MDKTKRKFLSPLNMLLVGILLCYPTNHVFAQTSGVQSVTQQESKIITGRVVDEFGDPLIGVSVTIQGTSEGTITDVDGNYSIRVGGDHQVLQFSYVGHYTTTRPADRNRINVTLREDTKLLDELVVVGFGTQRRANLTGAVSSVDVGRTLADRPVADVGRNLQGTVPGLFISAPSGEVGSELVVNIRGGIASLVGSSTPLILLDNVEIPSLDLINPDDVESITILRDAAAASIYGARASLGVILITTRQGARTDRISVNYSNNFSWADVARPINMAGIDGLEYSIEAMRRVGAARTGVFWTLCEESFALAQQWQTIHGGTVGPHAPFVYGRDWYVASDGFRRGLRLFDPMDYMIKRWTPAQTHNLSLSGRSGRTQYHIALGYFHQTGVLKAAERDDFTRYNASTRLTTEVNSWLTLRSGFLYSLRNRSMPFTNVINAANNHWGQLYRWSPMFPFGDDEHGNIMRSPAQQAQQANQSTRMDNYMNYTVGATITFTPNWNLVADYTYTTDARTINRLGTRYEFAQTWFDTAHGPRFDEYGNRVFVNNLGQVVSPSAPGAMPAYLLQVVQDPVPGTGIDHIFRSSRWHQMHTANIFSTYNWKLNETNEFTFMAGTNIVAHTTMFHSSQRNHLIDLINPSFNRAIGEQFVTGSDLWGAQLGFFGRINYAYDNRYLLEMNLRRDGSSNFPTHLQWRTFPSASAGWVITEESFMESLQPTLNFGRIRASWGVIGDQTVPPDLFLSTIAFNNNSLWLTNGQLTSMFRTPVMVQPDIGWQDFETLNFGIDVRLLSSALGVSFDWYRRDTREMITAGLTLPHAAGSPTPRGNFSHLRTTGWELAIDYNRRFRNGLTLHGLFTMSDAVTYIHDFDRNAPKFFGATQYWKGKRLGDIWGFETDGLFQWDDFVYTVDAQGNRHLVEIFVPFDPNNPDGGGALMWQLRGDDPTYAPRLQTPADFRFGPGDVRYVSQTGGNRVDWGNRTADDPGDMIVIGNTLPRFVYGFRFGGDYRGFDFSMLWQGVASRQIWGDGALAVPGYNTADGAMPQAIAGNFWREDRTDAFYPRPWNVGAVAWGPTAMANTHPNDRFLLNMAYLRLKNLAIGYSFSPELLRHVHLTRARVFVALENFLTFDNLRGLPIDPESVPDFRGDGMHNLTYNAVRIGVGAPVFRNVSFGMQVTL